MLMEKHEKSENDAIRIATSILAANPDWKPGEEAKTPVEVLRAIHSDPPPSPPPVIRPRQDEPRKPPRQAGTTADSIAKLQIGDKPVLKPKPEAEPEPVEKPVPSPSPDPAARTAVSRAVIRHRAMVAIGTVLLPFDDYEAAEVLTALLKEIRQ